MMADRISTTSPATQQRARKRGQATVEFALLIGVLLAIIYGILEVSRLVFISAEIDNASREAARYVSLNPSGPSMNPEAFRSAITSRLALVDPNDVTITIPPHVICEFCPVTVTVSYPWRTLVPLLGLGPLTLTSTSTALIENSRN